MLNKVIFPYLLFAVYTLLRWTWRIQIHQTDFVSSMIKENKSFVVAHWHGDELGILHLLKKYHIACIVSTSKDGDIMNKAVQLVGAETVRGSSTRGGTQALRGIIRLKKRGRRPSVAVDGPKGPIYEPKPGIFQISRLTDLPIVPISFHASRLFIFEKSWNKSRLPLPFARLTIQWGEPMDSLKKEDDCKNPKFAIQLKNLLNDTKNKAAKNSF